MSDILTTTLLRKGETAAKVLVSEGWPKKTHQKLIDKQYNKEYKKTADDPTTKLPNPTSLSWPIANPVEYKILKTDTGKIWKELLRLDKIRVGLEKDIAMTAKMDTDKIDIIEKRISIWSKKFDLYKAGHTSLYVQCAKTASSCGDAKIGMQMSNKLMDDATKQKDKLAKELNDYVKKGGGGERFLIALEGLNMRLAPLKKEQESLMKEWFEATKKVVKLAIVMP